MVATRFPLFCACFPNKKNVNETQEDAYSSVQPSTSNAPLQAPIAAFQRSLDADPDEPSSRPRSQISGKSKTHSFGFSWSKMKGLKDRKLPNPPNQSRSKGVSFSRNDIPHIDDVIPTYESIDVDSSSDVMYSKVDEKQRYDYPTFPNRQNKRKPTEEAVYASASQTYSVTSEDPYSSIASDADPLKPTNESVGYARVNEENLKLRRQKFVSNNNVEDLYAKVNRKAFDRVQQNGLLPSTSGIRNLQQVQPSTSTMFHTYTDDPYQIEESGSGSVTSSDSRQPSYRYLTVRETLGVIRERIRRRNEEAEQNNQNAEINNSTTKEHYYSTISNDYESVRNDEDHPSSSNYVQRPRIVNSNQPVYSGFISPLTINTNLMPATDSHTLINSTQPPVPTSPVPNRTPSNSMLENAAMVRSCCDQCLRSSSDFLVSARDNFFKTNHNALDNQTARRSALKSIQLPPLPSARQPLASSIEIRVACSNSIDTRPIIVSLANLLRRGGSEPDVTTSNYVDRSSRLSHYHKRSRIPLPTKLRVSSQSPTIRHKRVDVNLNKEQITRVSEPLFTPVGHDYVSVLDLDDGRGWPLNRAM
ncbi:hypothetical protein M3Y96_00217700 [Aphelenchoides besseyi]|nr:hypothetical protein M3Y96_00217700 [Aphelenchoides besseyi]